MLTSLKYLHPLICNSPSHYNSIYVSLNSLLLNFNDVHVNFTYRFDNINNTFVNMTKAAGNASCAQLTSVAKLLTQ